MQLRRAWCRRHPRRRLGRPRPRRLGPAGTGRARVALADHGEHVSADDSAEREDIATPQRVLRAGDLPALRCPPREPRPSSSAAGRRAATSAHDPACGAVDELRRSRVMGELEGAGDPLIEVIGGLRHPPAHLSADAGLRAGGARPGYCSGDRAFRSSCPPMCSDVATVLAARIGVDDGTRRDAAAGADRARATLPPGVLGRLTFDRACRVRCGGCDACSDAPTNTQRRPPWPSKFSPQCSPTLSSTTAAAAIDFYVKAFDAVELRQGAGPGRQALSTPHWGSTAATVMLNDDFPEMSGGKSMTPTCARRFPCHDPPRPSPMSTRKFQRAVDAGATVVMPVEDQFWGDRYGVLPRPVRPPVVDGPAGARGQRWRRSPRRSSQH